MNTGRKPGQEEAEDKRRLVVEYEFEGQDDGERNVRMGRGRQAFLGSVTGKFSLGCIGDRVQWFRAEAEMQRWQEQVEGKLAELLRTIRSFGKMKDIWTKLSCMQADDLPGHVAYAKRQAAIYARLECDSKKKLGDVGYKQLLSMEGTIVDFVLAKRVEEQAFLETALKEHNSEFFFPV